MPLPPGESRLLRRHFLASGEQVLLETHPSRWWYFFAPSAALPFLLFFDYVVLTRVNTTLPQVPYLSSWLAGLPRMDGYSATYLFGLIAVALTVFWILWDLGRTYAWASQTYAVTDDRIIQQTGLVRHVIQEIPIRQIRDVDVFQRSLWARILRYGNLRFKSLSEIDPPGVASEFSALENIFNPMHPLAKRSGVEWWVGVPNPFLIERTVEGGTRAAFAARPPGGPAP